MDEMRKLVDRLNETAYQYYVLDEPTISDKEWDALYDELVRLEKETGVRLPDSPTRRVGGAVLAGFEPLTKIGVFCFAFAVLFYVVTLPVEFNASGRAVKVLAGGYLSQDEVKGVKAMLSAAAMTYVAAALQAVLQLVRLLLISGSRRRRD